MLMKRIILSVTIFVLLQTNYAYSKDLLLYGGSGHKEFLGCLNCGEYSSKSICNEHGTFGSGYSSSSIFNDYGTYGSEYSSSSPWNEYSSSNSVPVVVDKQGDFYGYLTINKFRSKAVNFADTLNDIYESVDGDLDKVQEKLCEFLN
mgnify:CR=1 FL=1